MTDAKERKPVSAKKAAQSAANLEKARCSCCQGGR